MPPKNMRPVDKINAQLRSQQKQINELLEIVKGLTEKAQADEIVKKDAAELSKSGWFF
tara:strand:+ start:446 stop:619 length:174 start_codon:yes stop_codon:yes gene_type:complete